MQVLKVEMPDVGFKPFAPQGEALGFEFPPDCGSQYWDGVYGDIVSQLLLSTSIWTFCHLPDM